MMQKIKLVSIIVFSLFFSCKNKSITKNLIIDKLVLADDLERTTNNLESRLPSFIKLSKNDLKEVLQGIKGIKYTGDKHSDWMTNKVGFVDKLLNVGMTDLIAKSHSFEYKKDYILYVHSIKHVNNTMSLKPYIENAQGKYTEGYLGARVLIFAMKNDKEANFIDIPLTSGYSKKYNEVIKKVYDKIDFAVISCDSTKACEYKDLGK